MMLGLGKEALIEYGRKRGPVIVRGWKSGEQGYLLTEKPAAPMSPLTPGQEAVIRMEHDGILFGIAVTYRECLAKTDLCYFTFQDDVISLSLREDERLPCLIQAGISYADDRFATKESGLIVDLGKRGIRFVTRVALHTEVGELLSISFEAGGIGFIDRQKMRLMRVNNLGGRFEYAAQFVDMGDGHGELLNEYFTFCKAWTL